MTDRATPSPSSKPRLLTGDRPTGPLHLGHLLGSLQNRVALQDSHESFVIVADLHTLTTRPEPTWISGLPHNVRAIVLDLLAVGIDPERTTIYLQSAVHAVYDLAVLLQMLIPASQLREIDSLRQMAQTAGVAEDQISLGLLGYPVLQAADILMARAEVIPVGGDNLAHIEIAREVAARFNSLYGEVFPIPEARSARVKLLPGIGPEGPTAKKMSKSAKNTIDLADSPEVVSAKVRTLSGSRLIGFVDALIEDRDEAAGLTEQLRGGSLSEAAGHERLNAAVEGLLVPIRERRAQLASDDGRVEEILVNGTIRAREVAYQTLQRVRETMGLQGLWQDMVDVAERRAKARKKPY